MKIAAVLGRKGPEFDTVTKDASLLSAIELMHRKAIGSVGVVGRSANEILGLISQQELTAALAIHGPVALQQPASGFMDSQVLACSCGDDAAHIMNTMTTRRRRHALVLAASGAVAGLVSLGDLVAALLEETRLETGVLRDLARSRLLGLPA